MVDVLSKKCAHAGCETQPKYNKKGERGGRFCTSHKLLGMVDVLCRQCAEAGCHTRPVFNVAGAKRGVYCSIHKQFGMVDVISTRCEQDSCNKGPVFNMDGACTAVPTSCLEWWMWSTQGVHTRTAGKGRCSTLKALQEVVSVVATKRLV